MIYTGRLLQSLAACDEWWLTCEVPAAREFRATASREELTHMLGTVFEARREREAASGIWQVPLSQAPHRNGNGSNRSNDDG
jgi:hypothetical protein